MNYSIGTVAKLLGVSVETIRNYEKKGIISPKRDDANGYRNFTYLDITSLIRVRNYRAMGFQNTDLYELINNMSPDTIGDLILQKAEDLSKEKQLLEEIIFYQKHYAEDILSCNQNINTIRMEQKSEFYRMEFALNGSVNDDAALEQLSDWLKCAPFIYVSNRYADNNVYGGIGIEARHARLFDLPIPENVITIKPTTFLSTIVVEDNETYSNYHCIDRLLSFAKQHQFNITGDVISRSIISVNKSDNYTRYRELMVPIEQD